MSTGAVQDDFQAFCAYLGALQNSGDCNLTPEESVAQFREQQVKLRRFQEGNRVAEQQSQAGLSKPLDLDAVLTRVEERAARASHQD